MQVHGRRFNNLIFNESCSFPQRKNIAISKKIAQQLKINSSLNFETLYMYTFISQITPDRHLILKIYVFSIFKDESCIYFNSMYNSLNEIDIQILTYVKLA